MAEPPATRPSLLVRIRDSRDALAWTEFVRLYAPLVYDYARRRGLQDADAADLTQEVLRSVAGAVPGFTYDPQKGYFRGWLFTVVQNKLRNFLEGRTRHLQGTGDSGVQVRLEEQAAPESLETSWWNLEYERHLLTHALSQVRSGFQESSWQAFWQTAMEGKKAKDVAAALGLSVAAVYMAKSRVTAQLKEQISRLQGD